MLIEGRIAAITPAASLLRRRPAPGDGRRDCSAAVRRRAYPSRQGPHLAARRQSHGHLRRRAGDSRRRSAAHWTRARRRRADGVQPARRLCARHWRDSHAYRQRRSADQDQLAGVRRGARALARQDRAASLPAVHHRFGARRGAHGRRRGDGRRARLRHSRRGDPDRDARARRSGRPVQPRRAQGLGPRFPCRRNRRSRGALARRHRGDGAGAQISGAHSRRPLLLARAAGRRRDAAHDRPGRARRNQRRLAADVQYVPAGPARRPHAALARRHRVARIEGGGRQRHDRERQHARSVLRLWRSRHDGSLARGRADLASRLSRRRLGARRVRRSGARHRRRSAASFASARAPT